MITSSSLFTTHISYRYTYPMPSGYLSFNIQLVSQNQHTKNIIIFSYKYYPCCPPEQPGNTTTLSSQTHGSNSYITLPTSKPHPVPPLQLPYSALNPVCHELPLANYNSFFIYLQFAFPPIHSPHFQHYLL